jgi:hypothetical protein
MSDQPENMVLVFLRRLDQKMDRVIDDLSDLKLRVSTLESRVSSLAGAVARIEGSVARLDA